jgi:hypothetical protein
VKKEEEAMGEKKGGYIYTRINDLHFSCIIVYDRVALLLLYGSSFFFSFLCLLSFFLVIKTGAAFSLCCVLCCFVVYKNVGWLALYTPPAESDFLLVRLWRSHPPAGSSIRLAAAVFPTTPRQLGPSGGH